MTDSKINEFVTFSHYLADLSADIAKKYFRQNFGEKTKLDDTPVTLADKEIETIIRSEIEKRFPSHGIIGEELTDIKTDADYKWIIDPIDGTASFIIGRPIFGTLICLSYKNKPLIGMINQPIIGERWVGVAKQYSKFNGQNIKSRNCQNIANAVLCTTSSFFFKGKELDIFTNIASKTKYQSQGWVIYGGDCYLYGLLALGFIDIIIETGLSNYDYMALIPILEEAGGTISDWEGKNLDLNSNGKILACGDKNLHSQILQLIHS